MVSNNNISSPSNKSSTSEESEIATPRNSVSPVTKNAQPPLSPLRASSTSNKFPGKDLPPPQPSDQTPARFLAQCSKLDLEPNPFEQSFSHVTPVGETPGGNSPKPSLPPVASITSPSAGLPASENQYGWNLQSLRSGPLSPSMLEGPQNPIVFDDLPNGRTGTTPIPFNTFQEAPATIFGAPVNGSIPSTMPVISINTIDPYARGVFTQGVPRPLTDTERTKISTQSAAVPIVQTPVTGPALLSIANGPNATNSASNLMISNQLGATPLLMANSALNGRILSDPQKDSQSHRNDAGISEAVVTKTENDDFASLISNGQNLYTPRNRRPSNGMSANVSVAASTSTASSDDGYDEEQYDGLDSHRINSATSSPVTGTRNGRRKAEDNLSEQPPLKKSQPQKVKNDLTDEEKRRNFLERNRQAALKCRQRKKQWLANLQAKVEYLTQDNENLQNQATSLREEILNLKTLLLAHKDCPITQNGVMGLETIQNVAGLPQSMASMNVGPAGVTMGVGVGMVSNGIQGNTNMTGGVPVAGSISMSHVPQHMSNQMNSQINGQQTSGMMRY